MAKPIFIFSLPRSGSTLLQRLLMSSGECASLGEPTLLLRFLGDGSRVARYTSYRETNLEASLCDIRKKWDGFDQVYNRRVNDLMSEVYDNLAEGKRYFLDKTPRYTLIAEEIKECFPDAKFIVLWRHPLAIAASITSTFFKNKWRFEDFEIDLTIGLDRLNDFERNHADEICSIRYEDLAQSPAKVLGKIGHYLGIDQLALRAAEKLPESTGGTLGDPTGTKKYTTISSNSRDQWIHEYNNWYRRKWARDYFKHSRSKWLADKGYTLPEIITSDNGGAYLTGLKEKIYVKTKRRSRERRMIRAMHKDFLTPQKHNAPKN